MGDLKVETDALLRDNNFGPDDFSDAVMKNIGFDEWSISNESEEALASRRDFREETTFTIDPNGTLELDDAMHVKHLADGTIEVGIHVADAAHFIKANSLVDREARKRGTGVYLMNREVSMLPPRLSSDICSLSPGEERFTVSVVFRVDLNDGRVVNDEVWIGKAMIKSKGKITYDEVDAVIQGGEVNLQGATANDIQILKVGPSIPIPTHAAYLHQTIAQKFREARYGAQSGVIAPLRLIHQLDDENVPVEHNIFDSTPAHEIIEELSHKANCYVAQKIAAALPEKAFLRRQAPPNPRRLQTFAERMTRLGYEIDITNSGTLQKSLFNVQDVDLRKVSAFSTPSGKMLIFPGHGNSFSEGNAASQVLCCCSNSPRTISSLCAQSAILHTFYKPLSPVCRYHCSPTIGLNPFGRVYGLHGRY